MLVFSFCLLAAPSAFAAASYVFEPTLSLTGNCATSATLDPVPDPGLCPIPPGVPGVDHPSAKFESPNVTTDAYGDIYVANMREEKGRIDVFSPEGKFITEFGDSAGPQSIAVDSKGNFYAFERIAGGELQVRRFSPIAYEPLKEEIEYGGKPFLVADRTTKPLLSPVGPEASLTVNPADDRLYVDTSVAVKVFGTAAEENKLLDSEAITGLNRSSSIAIDAKHERIYISDRVPITLKSTIRIFELNGTHKELGQIDGSTTPKGEFLSGEGFLSVDVDENAGHVFVGDIEAAKKVYEFEEDGTYLATIEHNFTMVPFEEIAVDDGKFSPRPQKEGWLFVPTEPAPALGHVYAFEPREEGPPIIESVSAGDITETEATLHATINPDGLMTTYRFEYVSEEQFKEEGGESFEEGNAELAGEGTLPKGGEGVAVSVTAEGLEPGTRYVFRVFASNENAKKEEGKDEELGTFQTFASTEHGVGTCSNETLRTGLSALLPDCRAYELVTPPNTNGRPPSGGFIGVYFQTLRAAPDGNRASFVLEGGALPSQEGTGAFNGDSYLATRTSEGWSTALAGPRGEELERPPSPGSVSPDQTYSFWENIKGPVINIRYPDGHSELVGRGSLGEDPAVGADLITEGAGHIVFTSSAHLEENSPPAGTAVVYDRSAEGPTHVVSLLPGEVVPAEKQNASYLGASEDGEGIAFSIGGTIYVRLHNTETLEVAGSGSTFAGVSEEGKRVFYTEGGDLFAYDTEAKATIPFSATGNVTPVNVASNGTRAYFVSPSVLTTEPNPEGDEAEVGAQNLYLSEEGQIGFVAKVTERDVKGESTTGGQVDGMGLWLSALKFKAPAIDSSRTTPTGTTLLFESRASLTGFESEGFAEIYRYDQTQNRLDCLSCNPTGTPSSSDASLQSIASEQFSLEPAGSHLEIRNQSPDGNRAFFQTAEPLVIADSDGKLDVYEWEEQGVGSCEAEGGCVSLISGPNSAGPDYLYAMSANGNNVFFRTADRILPRDAEATLSIYDARVGGGFAEPQERIPCNAIDTCQSGPALPPVLPAPGERTPSGGNVTPQKKHCPKGKHVAKRHGKEVCVKNHKKRHPHHKAGTKKKGGSR